MRYVFLLAGLLALAAITWVAINRVAPHLEADIAARATVALLNDGIDWANVNVDGRTLTIAGTTRDDAARAQAVEIVRRIAGVRNVIDTVRVAGGSSAPARAVVINMTDDVVNASGSLRDAASIDALTEVARLEFAGRTINSTLSVDAHALATPPELVAAAITALNQLSSGTVTLSDGSVRLDGLAASPAGRRRANDALTAILPPGFDLNLAIEVPQPAQSAATCQAALDDLLGEGISFAVDGTELRRESHNVLDQIVRILQACPGLDINLGAHTDSAGDETRNVQLTVGRAATVRDYLVAGGVDASRIETRGYGSARPLSRDDTAAGRRANRRIVITIGTPEP